MTILLKAIITAKQNLNHPVSFSDLPIVKTPYCREIERGLLLIEDEIIADSQLYTIFANGKLELFFLRIIIFSVTIYAD